MALPPRSGWLVAAALSSFAIVVLHFGIILFGAPAYAWVVAPERIQELARQGSLFPTLVTGGLAGVFVIFGLYALAGAGFLTLPAQRQLVVAIGCTYLLRGTLIVPEAILVQFMGRPPRTLAFAAVSFAIGLLYVIGAWRRWAELDGPDPVSTRA